MPVGVTIKTRRGTAAEWVAAGDPVLDAGEPGLETDTGAVKYGDGASKFSELPNVRKQFQSVITVAKTGKPGTADFICSDAQWGGDDAACIQAAIDSVPTSGGILYIEKNIYRIGTSLDFKGKGNIHIISDATFVRLQTLSSPILTNSGSSVGTPYIITNTYGPGIKTLTITNSSSFNVGDVIYIVELGSTTYERIDIIESVDTVNNTVTLQTGLKWGTIANSSSVRTINNIISNISIEGLTFTDEVYEATSRSDMIQLCYAKNVALNSLKFYNISGSSAIYITHSIFCNLSDINIDSVLWSTIDLGYGISTYGGTSFVNINNCTINGCRHATTGDRSYDINISNVTANGMNLITSTSLSFDTHQYMKDVTYTNCISNGALGGLNVRGQRITANNMIINSTSTHGLVIQSIANDVTINNMQINNINTWSENVTAYAAYINSSNVLINNLKIIQNTIPVGSNPRGVYILNSSHIFINNLQIDDRCVTPYSFVHGIELTGTNSDIQINHGAINTLKSGGYSLTLSTGTSNCIISDIIATKTIANNGTNNKIKNISSYITENTGTATILSTQTSITVSHGLALTPTNVIITPRGNVGNVWADTFTSTQFTIHCSSAPVADTIIGWSAVV